jgi:hypothetical protein
MNLSVVFSFKDYNLWPDGKTNDVDYIKDQAKMTQTYKEWYDMNAPEPDHDIYFSIQFASETITVTFES